MKSIYFDNNEVGAEFYKAVRFGYFNMCLWLGLAFQTDDKLNLIGNLVPTIATGICLGSLFFIFGKERVKNIVFDVCSGMFLILAIQIFLRDYFCHLACALTIIMYAETWKYAQELKKNKNWASVDIVECSFNFVNSFLWVVLSVNDWDFMCFVSFLVGFTGYIQILFYYFLIRYRKKHEKVGIDKEN